MYGYERRERKCDAYGRFCESNFAVICDIKFLIFVFLFSLFVFFFFLEPQWMVWMGGPDWTGGLVGRCYFAKKAVL